VPRGALGRGLQGHRIARLLLEEIDQQRHQPGGGPHAVMEVLGKVPRERLLLVAADDLLASGTSSQQPP
jgi:hypothetical protein